jgi:large subunit ribosomal protein L10
MRGKDFYFWKGGEILAISREKKEQLVAQYGQWIEESEAFVLTKYIGLSVSELDELRRDIREANGNFHIVKNTLMKIAFENADLEYDEDLFIGDTAIGYASENMPGLAKALVDFAEESEYLQMKTGYFNGERVSIDDIKRLAEVPPLPVLRSQLLSALLAPATKLASTLSEPGRQLAAVLKAYADQDAAPEAA